MNIHPPLSAFPGVLLCVIVLLELLGLYRDCSARRGTIVVLSIITAIIFPATYFSGYVGSEYANATFKISDELIAYHHDLGTILFFTLYPCGLMLFLKCQAKDLNKLWSTLYYLFLAASLVVVLLTGYEGGKLVFTHGAGVSAIQRE